MGFDNLLVTRPKAVAARPLRLDRDLMECR
jgi:hypothetical protein